MSKKPKETAAPAMGVQMWAVADIKPYPNNPRTHPPSQVTMLARLIEKYGADQPIVVDEDGIILKGHGRRLAAIEVGVTEFPVVQRFGLPDVDKIAMRVEDNQSSLLSGWDPILISGELKTLKLAGFDIPLLGFPEAQLRGWSISSGTDGVVDPDAAPEPPKKPVVRKGDLWILGDHRLLCGSSTIEKDVALLAGNDLGQMVFTDPPYGVKYRDTGAGAWNADKLAKKRAGMLRPRFNAIENDDLSEEDLLAFLIAYMRLQPIKKNAAQYVCHASLRAHVFREAILASDYVVRAECIWAKSRPGFNFAHYKHKHEPIYYAVPVKGTTAWYGDKTQTTLWQVASESGAVYEHPTQKPVGLPVIAISNSSKTGDFVYEPFSGSGTTIIACEMTGRKAIAIELDPAYVQVAVERWQNFTGRKATLDGKTLEQVAKARRSGRPKAAADEARPGI